MPFGIVGRRGGGRRPSRIPPEEDGSLMNFLASLGTADDSRERNLSVGNLGE